MKKRKTEETEEEKMEKIKLFIKNLKMTVDPNILNNFERSTCTTCHRKRMYYCYSCMIPLEDSKDKLPKIKLPIKITM
jgi:hypothetical protein